MEHERAKSQFIDVIGAHGARWALLDAELHTERIALAELLPADSPRLAGEDDEHTRVLADSGAKLPPVIVHRGTMRIIDGMHRVGAAQLRGETCIEVQFFDGTVQEAFILAVQSNITHGRPLSLQDRMVAAERIINENPTWSDRAIADATGLGGSTVGGIRRRVELTSDTARGTRARIGRDGRRRPVDQAEGRRRAAAIMRKDPDASLRDVARKAGVSPSTAQDVRNRLRRGEEPVPARQVTAGSGLARRKQRRTPADPDHPGLEETLKGLQRDPSLRFSENGRALVRWLTTRAVRFEDWQQVSGEVPTHCTYILVDVARRVADEWLHIAEDLQSRARQMA